MQAGGRIDAVFFCPHSSEEKCDCRKPKPGLMRQIAERYNTDLAGVPTVGDSLRDLQSAVAVGAQPYLVLTGKGEKTRKEAELPAQTIVFPTLAAFAQKVAS